MAHTVRTVLRRGDRKETAESGRIFHKKCHALAQIFLHALGADTKAGNALLFVDVSSNIGAVLEQMRRKRSRLVDVKIKLHSVAGKLFDQVTNARKSLLISLAQLGKKFVGRQLGHDRLRPDTVDTHALIRAKHLIGKRNVDQLLVKKSISVERAVRIQEARFRLHFGRVALGKHGLLEEVKGFDGRLRGVLIDLLGNASDLGSSSLSVLVEFLNAKVSRICLKTSHFIPQKVVLLDDKGKVFHRPIKKHAHLIVIQKMPTVSDQRDIAARPPFGHHLDRKIEPHFVCHTKHDRRLHLKHLRHFFGRHKSPISIDKALCFGRKPFKIQANALSDLRKFNHSKHL